MVRIIYHPHDLTVTSNQTNKLKKAISSNSKGVSLLFNKDAIQKNQAGEHKLLLTKRQIKKLHQAKTNEKPCRIILSRQQIKANVEHEGGFLGILSALAPMILKMGMTAAPHLLGGLATGLATAGVEKLLHRGSGYVANKRGCGFFMHKKQHCYKVTPTKGRGLYLRPHPRFAGYGDGFLVKNGKEIKDASGLLLGPDSPFKNIPLLGLIL